MKKEAFKTYKTLSALCEALHDEGAPILSGVEILNHASERLFAGCFGEVADVCDVLARYGENGRFLYDVEAYGDNYAPPVYIKDASQLERFADDSTETIREKLQHLRSEIILGSIYIDDYDNRYNIPPRNVCIFFEGFCEYIGELMQADGVSDSQYYDNVSKYDNIDNLAAWYAMAGEILGDF